MLATVANSNHIPLVRGEAFAHVPVSLPMRAAAAALAKAYFEAQALIDFCGDSVETLLVPDWVPDRPDWLPVLALQERGLAPLTTGAADELVLTLGVDAHVDDLHGPVLCWVLHNEGLRFKQGRQSYTHQAGDIFVFNDRIAHSMSSAPGESAFIGLVVPLQDCR